MLAKARRKNPFRRSDDGVFISLRISDGKCTETLVDSDVFERIRDNKWTLHSAGYAIGQTSGAHGRRIYLHRYITMAPEHLEVDHINGNRLDNRASNLRIVTGCQNKQNVRPVGKSGFRGVYFESQTKKWRASVQVAGVSHRSGRFDSIEDAKVAAVELRNRYLTHHNPDRDQSINP